MAYGAIIGQTPTVQASAEMTSYNNDNTSSVITADNVQGAIDQLFTSVSNGKSQIASAITDMGVSTSANDSFAQMATNIGNIETGYDTSQVTATANTVRSGYKFVNSSGQLITGTIPSKGAQTYTPKTVSQTISSGQYLSGNQTIQGDGNLVASNIKSGVSIFGVSGSYTGNISVIDINEDFVRASGTLWKVNISTAISIAYEGGLTPIQYPSQIKKILGLGGIIADGADTSRGGVVGGIWYRQSNYGGYHGLLSTNAIDGFYRTITSDVIVSGNNMIITLEQSYSGEGRGLDFNGILAFEY